MYIYLNYIYNLSVYLYINTYRPIRPFTHAYVFACFEHIYVYIYITLHTT